jgi:diaminopimelate decarboxylase
VERFGSPLYVYSARSVVDRFLQVKRAFSRLDPLICYALKANSNRAVCALLARRGAGADIVSGGELERALAAGFPAERVVFSGVGKTQDELALGLRRGVLTFNVESSEELGALEAAAGRLKKRAPVSIRLNPDVDAKTHPHITTGRAHNKFGVERGEAVALALRAARAKSLRFMGFQAHIGSQIMTAAPYARSAKALCGALGELARAGYGAELADVGGGFGIDYQTGKTVDLEAVASAVGKGLAPCRPARLIVEPGRFLVADSGFLLARVLYRKKTSKAEFVVVDAAMNDLARPALYGAYHPVVPARPRAGRTRLVDVVGPICESGDFLARGRRLPPLERGDVLAVARAGAYGFAMSSQYNSRPRAAEVLVEAGKARLVRRRETLKDVVGHER